MHLINPINLRLTLQKCLITDDPRLPLMKLAGELPSIDVTVTDTRLVMLLDLIFSVQFPNAVDELPEPKPLGESRSRGSSMMMLRYIDMQEKALSTREKLEKKRVDSNQLLQFTTVDLKFVMSGEFDTHLPLPCIRFHALTRTKLQLLNDSFPSCVFFTFTKELLERQLPLRSTPL